MPELLAPNDQDYQGEVQLRQTQGSSQRQPIMLIADEKYMYATMQDGSRPRRAEMQHKARKQNHITDP